MSGQDENRPFPIWRLLSLAAVFCLGGLLILVNLHRIQIEEEAYFTRGQDRQSLRRGQTPGRRGRILDRNGAVLADNRPDYCILLHPNELRRPGAWSNTVNNIEARMRRIADELGLEPCITRRRIARHLNETPYRPIVAFRHVGEVAQAVISERFDDFPGAELVAFPERDYPFGSAAAQVLGYTSNVRPEPSDSPSHFYLPEMKGRAGLERQYDAILSGSNGEELVRIDSRGYRREVQPGKPAAPGSDIRVTLDIELQKVLEEAFGERRGAAVVLVPETGEVLAMVSKPGYDNNAMSPAPSTDFWRSLIAPESHQPLLNRAVQGLYPPGSTFKPFTALAALGAGFSTNWTHLCEGQYVVSHTRIRCWNTYGHGELGLVDALEHSCNPYFCHLAQEVGYGAIARVGRELGLGARTGIDLPAESRGLLPTPEWKLQALGEPWRASDTSLVAIGQGTLLTTPLQMAVGAAALANGGRIVRPHLLMGRGVPPARPTSWRPEDLIAVREGMVAVTEFGSGRRAAIPGIRVAAKTGTAEYDRDGQRKKFTWMIAYAPADEAKAAVAVVVEDGQSGGVTAAPLARKALVAALGLEDVAREVPDSEVIHD